MEPFGKAAWMLLLAACACLPFAGCTKTPAERFETYNRLKKTTAEQPADTRNSEVADTGPALSSAPDLPAPPIAAQKTTPVTVMHSTSSAPVPNSPPVMTQAQAQTEKKASGAVPAVPLKSPAAPLVQPTSGTSGSVGAYHASIASSVPGPAAGPLPASGAGRKVQLLIPQRNFKPEGPDGAWRVSYDDIDLLKILNMDPVTPNAGSLMPAWLKGLEGRRIRIRGYMYPTFQQTGIHAFGLARDNQICCFGRNPKIYDIFDVLLRDGVTTDYLPNRPFDVVGVFHIRPEIEDGKLYHLYEMDDATVIAK
jgi:hypothetical protein